MNQPICKTDSNGTKEWLRKEAECFDYPLVVDWKKVAKEYDGIDIRYNDKADDLMYWYSTWDCSSGCIWHKRAVKDIKLIQVVV